MKIAVITGASSGLGKQFVKILDREENLDEIWVIARRKERLESLSAEMKTPIKALAYDLTNTASFEEYSRILSEERPDIRVLINAAGFGKIGSYKDISMTDCNNMIELNCRAAVDMTQLSIPYMSKGSRILEICSTSAFQPFQYLNIYAATKAFLYRYSRALRKELRHTGIGVTAVCPYWIKDTEFIGTAQKTKNSGYIKSFPLSSKEQQVAKRAIKDSKLNLAVSTPGPVCSLHRAAAKIVPNSIMMALWELIRKM